MATDVLFPFYSILRLLWLLSSVHVCSQIEQHTWNLCLPLGADDLCCHVLIAPATRQKLPPSWAAASSGSSRIRTGALHTAVVVVAREPKPGVCSANLGCVHGRQEAATQAQAEKRRKTTRTAASASVHLYPGPPVRQAQPHMTKQERRG